MHGKWNGLRAPESGDMASSPLDRGSIQARLLLRQDQRALILSSRNAMETLKKVDFISSDELLLTLLSDNLYLFHRC